MEKKNVEIFNHEVFGNLEVVIYQEKPTFYANDVADLLGYSDTSKIRNHCKKLIKLSLRETKELGVKSNGNHGNFLIGVEDLKVVVSKCNMPNAKDLDRWLREILPDYSGKEMIFVRSEHVALDVIEQILGIKLIRQYRVLNYSVDGYHEETNTVYEIDEEYHSTVAQRMLDSPRQKAIEEELGCTFIRVKV